MVDLVRIGSIMNAVFPEPGSAPRNVLARPLSSSTVVVQWDPPMEPNGQVMGYRIIYTKNPTLPETAWQEFQVDSSQLTTISNLTPQATYTIRVSSRHETETRSLSVLSIAWMEENIPRDSAI